MFEKQGEVVIICNSSKPAIWSLHSDDACFG